MKGIALLGILLILYSAAVIGLTIKKPKNIWDMPKIRFFRRILGEKGTDVFFVLFALVVGGIGIWLMIK